MKDIIITVKVQKREIKIFLFCFLISFLLNVISIVIYDTDWKEVYTQIFWVLLLSFFFYVLYFIIRVVFFILLNRLKNK